MTIMQTILPELRRLSSKDSKRVLRAWLGAPFWKEDPWYCHWELWMSFLLLPGICLPGYYELSLLLRAALPGLPGTMITDTGALGLGFILAVVIVRLMYRPYRQRLTEFVEREAADHRQS